MHLRMLKAKLHRARVTGADLAYEGSIAIDARLCEAARILPWEQVDIYNCNTGARFATYVIPGRPGEVSLNGAAARLVQVGDEVIIACYAAFEEAEARSHQPRVLLLGPDNQIQQRKD